MQNKGKERKRKLLSLIMVLLLTASMLLACTNQQTNESSNNDQTQQTVEENQSEDQSSVNQDSDDTNNEVESKASSEKVVSIMDIPAYDGKSYATINGNEPAFTNKEKKNTSSFEQYGPLDSLGRCSTCFANVGQDLMPSEKRGSIGQVKPTGWHTIKYDNVDGKYLYNRCHLIGYQLTAENANERNLITGTRYLNIDGMLPFENLVADYVKETGNHVLYRVTPIYEENNLIAKGVQMEGYSVEDGGAGVYFNVFAYNVQPGIVINYQDGSSHEKESTSSSSTKVSNDNDSKSSTAITKGEIRGNTRSKIYHCPGQRDYNKMADSKNLIVFKSEKKAIEAGYRKAKL